MTILPKNTKDKSNKPSETAYFLPSTVKRRKEEEKKGTKKDRNLSEIAKQKKIPNIVRKENFKSCMC